MKIENQVCTLEQAKRLKELGVLQDGSLAVWFISSVGPFIQFRLNEETLPQEYAAYTVAELGEMLPDYITVDSYRMHPRFFKQEQNNSPALWTGTYGKTVDEDVPDFDFHNEAQLRAAMLIHLIENKLVSVDQINKSITQ